MLQEFVFEFGDFLTVDGDEGGIGHDDPVGEDRLHLIEVHDESFVDAAETMARERLLQTGHRVMDDVVAILRVQCLGMLVALGEQQAIQIDFDLVSIGFEKNRRPAVAFPPQIDEVLVQGLGDVVEEAVLPDEAIRLDLKGVKDFIFAVGDEDDVRFWVFLVDLLGEGNPVDSRHLDIEEKQVVGALAAAV